MLHFLSSTEKIPLEEFIQRFLEKRKVGSLYSSSTSMVNEIKNDKRTSKPSTFSVILASLAVSESTRWLDIVIFLQNGKENSRWPIKRQCGHLFKAASFPLRVNVGRTTIRFAHSFHLRRRCRRRL